MQSIFDLRELKIDLDYGLPNVGQEVLLDSSIDFDLTNGLFFTSR